MSKSLVRPRPWKSVGLLAISVFIGTSIARAGGVEWNGFGSFYGAKAFSDDIYPSGLSDKNPNFANFSNFGLNVGSRLTDTISAAAQFVVAGNSSSTPGFGPNWDVRANWAYLVWNACPHFRVKIGRQLYPDWLAAEFIDVGYLQPFRRMPASVGSISPFKGFEGLLLDYTFEFGDFGNLVWAMYGGRATRNFFLAGGGTLTIDTPNFYGTGLTYNGDGVRVRGQIARFASTSTVSVTLPENVRAAYVTNSATITYKNLTADGYAYQLGLSLEKFGFVWWSEVGFVQTEGPMLVSGIGSPAPGFAPTMDDLLASGGFGGQFLRTIRGGYTMLGYRFGDFMPRYMFAHSDWQAGILNGRDTVHTFGVNYYPNDNVVVKVDGELLVAPDAPDRPAFMTRNRTTTNTAFALYAGVDFVF